jgi:hypothetical protein
MSKNMSPSKVTFLFEDQKSLYKLAPHMYTESIPEDDWVGDILGSEDDALSSYSDAY